MLGFHFIDLLQKQQIQIVSCSRKQPTNLLNKNHWFYWDLKHWNNNQKIKKEIGKIEAIFHVGSYVPNFNEKINNGKILDTNVRSCINIAEYALEEKVPVCFISGATVYKNISSRKIKETDQTSCNGLGGFYGFSKLLSEQVFNYYSEKGLSLVIIRPSSIYGFGLDKEKLISKFINKLSNHEKIILKEPFSDKFNLIHAEDVVYASLKAMKSNSYSVYNISSDKLYSIKKIAQICHKIIGKGTVVLENKKLVSSNVSKKLFNLSNLRAKHELNFKPKYDLTNGLIKMIDDIKGV